MEKVKADAAKEAKEEASASFRENLLVLSQFLRLAAYRREEGGDPEADETQAIEGVLLAIYAGDSSAVNAMEKLVTGADEHVVSVPGEQLQSTCKWPDTFSKLDGIHVAYCPHRHLYQVPCTELHCS